MPFYFGTADGKFEDRREQLGFKRVTQPMGVNIGDIDNDGFLDCYIGTGYVDYEGLIPNVMFHNVEGKRLDDVTFSAKVGHLQKGHGVSLADFDEDGDLDIFAVMGGWFSGDAFARVVFENKGTDNRWLFIRLVGVESDRYGLGCRVKAQYTDSAGTKHILYRTMDAGGSFGDNPFRIHLGLRDANQVDELEVTWPTTGKTQQFKNVGVGRFIEITEGNAEIRELNYGQK
ncbi:MAG: CRTAC1 family protein [Pirellulales bacterium]